MCYMTHFQSHRCQSHSLISQPEMSKCIRKIAGELEIMQLLPIIVNLYAVIKFQHFVGIQGVPLRILRLWRKRRITI